MRLITLLLLCLQLVGCAGLDTVKESFSGISDYFSGGEDNAEPPSKLTEYTPEVKIQILWKERVGVGSEEKSLKLWPAIASGKIFAADKKGVVQARNLATGDLYWEAETGLPMSAGPGVGGATVVFGTSKAQVIALNSETGKSLWTVNVSSEILSVPVLANGVVVVHCTDGAVLGLDERSGVKLWSFETNVPALSVRGTSTPVIFEDQVIGGYDSGKLLALRLKDGKYVWEASVAIPKGRSEVERLVDIDSDLIIAGGSVFVASYHGGLSAVSVLDGELIWRNESISAYSGISSDWRYLYLSDADSDVWQLDQRNGSSMWKQKDLHQRQLSAPAAFDSYVVVGDFEGYVHWLSTLDGHLLGREQITSSPIDAKPIIEDNIVYVYAKDGTLAALKAVP